MHFEETGLPWVLPSPNMPTLDTARVYPGGCLLEGTLSEGRGTTRPFEIFGAPWVDRVALARRLQRSLCGHRDRPAADIPAHVPQACGKVCGGVQVHVLDRERFTPYRAYIAALRAFAQRATASPGARRSTSSSTTSPPSICSPAMRACARRSTRAKHWTRSWPSAKNACTRGRPRTVAVRSVSPRSRLY